MALCCLLVRATLSPWDACLLALACSGQPRERLCREGSPGKAWPVPALAAVCCRAQARPAMLWRQSGSARNSYVNSRSWSCQAALNWCAVCIAAMLSSSGPGCGSSPGEMPTTCQPYSRSSQLGSTPFLDLMWSTVQIVCQICLLQLWHCWQRAALHASCCATSHGVSVKTVF